MELVKNTTNKETFIKDNDFAIAVMLTSVIRLYPRFNSFNVVLLVSILANAIIPSSLILSLRYKSKRISLDIELLVIPYAIAVIPTFSIPVPFKYNSLSLRFV